MPKILDYVEYTETDKGWVSRKVHDQGTPAGEFEMVRGAQVAIDTDIEAIRAGIRPAWTLLGLPKIIVNGEVFRQADQP
ncbi:hypothetical protein FJZ36_19370 [Candidatus Poribacteria bacterium]|nr:hypothetical protein [Candidatus Poribacteria bacterium]